MTDKIITPDENPFGRNNSLVDTRGAILMDSVNVAMVTEGTRGQEGVVALNLGGRVNQSSARASLLFLFDADGVASIVSELLGLTHRAGDRFAADVTAALDERVDKLPKDNS